MRVALVDINEEAPESNPTAKVENQKRNHDAKEENDQNPEKADSD
jgi:hypothetical protein